MCQPFSALSELLTLKFERVHLLALGIAPVVSSRPVIYLIATEVNAGCFWYVSVL